MELEWLFTLVMFVGVDIAVPFDVGTSVGAGGVGPRVGTLCTLVGARVECVIAGMDTAVKSEATTAPVVGKSGIKRACFKTADVNASLLLAATAWTSSAASLDSVMISTWTCTEPSFNSTVTCSSCTEAVLAVSAWISSDKVAFWSSSSKLKSTP